MTTAASSAPLAAASTGRASRVRWVVCGLLLLVTANNYFDRQIFGVLAPELIRRFHWTRTDYTDLVTWFDIAYGVGFLVAGRFLDLVGTRLGFALAVGAWSLASVAARRRRLPSRIRLIRGLLGLSEAAHLPRPSRPSPNGFRRKSGRSPPGFTRRAATWVPSSCHCCFRGSI